MSVESEKIKQRVIDACEVLLKRNGTVGPLELLVQMGFLAGVHLEQWQKGNDVLNPLEPHIQCGEKKRNWTFQFFHEWVKAKNLEPVEASYLKASREGAKPLNIAADGNSETEMFFRTHYRSANLTPARKKQIEKKLNKVPDLVVFQITSSDSQCSECHEPLLRGSLLYKEGETGLCLVCADMDHLEFLPAGNVAMTRRSKKLSPLSAVVVRFNARRKRYERQGLLVTSAAIDAAEEQCNADEDQRADRRQTAALQRSKDDVQLIAEMAKQILKQFPNCPPTAAQQIANHAAVRGSGRVGRSAAGRELHPDAIELAVGAHVRHCHTDYDSLLMTGTERQLARVLIRDQQQSVLHKWRGD